MIFSTSTLNSKFLRSEKKDSSLKSTFGIEILFPDNFAMKFSRSRSILKSWIGVKNLFIFKEKSFEFEKTVLISISTLLDFKSKKPE